MSVQYQDRRARDLIEEAKLGIKIYRKYNDIDCLRRLIVGESTFAILVTNFQTGRLEHSAFAVMEALYDDYREHPELEINKAVQSVFDDSLSNDSHPMHLKNAISALLYQMRSEKQETAAFKLDCVKMLEELKSNLKKNREYFEGFSFFMEDVENYNSVLEENYNLHIL